jgi:hypothetical protein
MWYWAVIVAVVAGAMYAYIVSSKMVLSEKVGCSSCPSQKNEL